MNGKLAQVHRRAGDVQDEFGFFDSEQAGLEAAIRAVTALNARDDDAPLVERLREEESISEKRTSRAAVYQLEFPTRCPQCDKEIGEVHVSRLLRTYASFTSTLPRKGYMIMCPECDGILSAELSGLI